MASTLTDRLAGGAGLPMKAPCRVATTANLTLSGTQTVDGVALSESDRVLVKDQGSAAENGIYLVRTGAWERAPDWDGNNDVVEGTLVLVNQGTVNEDQIFVVTTTGTIIVGTTSVTLTGKGLAPTFPIGVTEGGTGATTAADARTNLGLGTIATQNANNVAITGGTISGVAANFTSGTITGITDLAIADGGTGASTASAAFDALKQAATTSATGVVELATDAEFLAQSDTTRTLTPSNIAAKPKFFVHKNGSNQTSVANNATTLLTWSTETFDVGGYFASNVYTPPAGHYRLSCVVEIQGVTAGTPYILQLFKNSSAVAVYRLRPQGTNGESMTVSAVVSANGTDTFDVRVQSTEATNKTIDGGATVSFFCGEMV